MDFSEQEDLNGIRFSWNVWPQTRMDATRIVVPIGCLFTPLKQTAALSLVEYDPVVCRNRNCNSVLNPYCPIDFRSKSWMCPFCAQRNPFPQNYASAMSEQNLPAELVSTSTTIEYILPQVGLFHQY
jgi:protein transport protein SEC23